MKEDSLSRIISPIKAELNQFDGIFKKSLKSKVGFVDLIASYLLKQKGKRIRPQLVLLAAKTAGELNERTHRGAVLVELLHTATLIHDDVVDNSDTRRGFPSINSIWKNKVAVLMGDYFLSRGLLIAVEGKDFDFLEIVSNTVKRMSEGELLQISKTKKLDIDEETYLKIISDKTASLFSACCEIGAGSVSIDPIKKEAMRNYGERLGAAFQIRDDILDYVGTSKIFGKPLGGDIKERKITLPLIYALRSSSNSEASGIVKLIKRGGKKREIKEVIEFVQNKGGIEAAAEKAQEYLDKAKESLSVFNDSEAKESLLLLANFVNSRNK